MFENLRYEVYIATILPKGKKLIELYTRWLVSFIASEIRPPDSSRSNEIFWEKLELGVGNTIFDRQIDNGLIF